MTECPCPAPAGWPVWTPDKGAGIAPGQRYAVVFPAGTVRILTATMYVGHGPAYHMHYEPTTTKGRNDATQ